MSEQTKTQIAEPSVLTANVYFWKPRGNANQRRRNAATHCNDVAAWFEALGLTIKKHSDECVIAANNEITAKFSYSESCQNVYRHLAVTKGGKRSNIKSLRKLQSY